MIKARNNQKKLFDAMNQTKVRENFMGILKGNKNFNRMI